MGHVTVESWTELANCKGQVDVWFSTDAVLLNAARRGCATCPVIDQCHRLATEIEPSHGVWAGQLWNRRGPSPRTRKPINDERGATGPEATAREGAR